MNPTDVFVHPARRLSLWLVAALGLVAFAAQPAAAVVDVSLALLDGPSKGISSFTFQFDVATNKIDIFETWTSTVPSYIQFRGLNPESTYIVCKHITNNTGINWDRFSNELLDPAGDGQDAEFDIANAAYVPIGFSHSSDGDGLSFAQGMGIPRTSTAFSLKLIDEDDGRDFIDFYNGSIGGGGGTDLVSYGLTMYQETQDGFLLVQRPNFVSLNAVPEPGTLGLLGLGLLGGASLRKKRRTG